MSYETADYFDSFNARSLRPREVAKTFVPPKAFSSLIKKRHSIIVGPRGTGKTTLLKMLQQSALEHWENPVADQTRQSVDFTGVFIATDVRWKSQIESLAASDFTEDECRLLTGAAFTTNVLFALCETMLRRLATNDAPHHHRRVSISEQQERNLVKILARAWYLDPPLLSLRALKTTLSERLIRVRELASSERVVGAAGRSERLRSVDWLHLQYLDALVTGVEAFDSEANQSEGLWAILFDELELAPTWIREQLFEALRSVDGRLLFKLSISPYDEQVKPTSMLAPMPDNDYDLIPLTYARRDDAYDFCSAIWSSMSNKTNSTKSSAVAKLGLSVFEEVQSEDADHKAYGPRSGHQKRFKELQRDDATFAEYLLKRGLDIDKLDSGVEKTRAAEVRKIISLVAVRHTYRMPDNSRSKQKIRSRKNPTLYVGARSLFAIVEANPRWLIAIGSRMIASAGEDGSIPPKIQNREVSAAADRFMAMLRTIPSESTAFNEPESSVGNLVQTVGEFFFRAAVLAPFNPEPPGTFVVDEKCSPQTFATLGRALNAGAIVYVPETDNESLLGDFTGKRFRLTYLLAPRFRIPIRLGRAVSLSRILASEESEESKDEPRDTSAQASLF